MFEPATPPTSVNGKASCYRNVCPGLHKYACNHIHTLAHLQTAAGQAPCLSPLRHPPAEMVKLVVTVTYAPAYINMHTITYIHWATCKQLPANSMLKPATPPTHINRAFPRPKRALALSPMTRFITICPYRYSLTCKQLPTCSVFDPATPPTHIDSKASCYRNVCPGLHKYTYNHIYILAHLQTAADLLRV